jgi:hypothetical protein
MDGEVLMKLEDIEKAVAELPADELAEFRKWFHAFDAEQWDRQFEQDVAKGKLDHFAEEAIADYEAGRAKKL